MFRAANAPIFNSLQLLVQLQTENFFYKTIPFSSHKTKDHWKNLIVLLKWCDVVVHHDGDDDNGNDVDNDDEDGDDFFSNAG